MELPETILFYSFASYASSIAMTTLRAFQRLVELCCTKEDNTIWKTKTLFLLSTWYFIFKNIPIILIENVQNAVM